MTAFSVTASQLGTALPLAGLSAKAGGCIAGANDTAHRIQARFEVRVQGNGHGCRACDSLEPNSATPGTLSSMGGRAG